MEANPLMSVGEQIVRLLRSRKFWALFAALASVAGAYFGGEITVWQALQAIIAGLAVYSTGVALEDAGAKFKK